MLFLQILLLELAYTQSLLNKNEAEKEQSQAVIFLTRTKNIFDSTFLIKKRKGNLSDLTLIFKTMLPFQQQPVQLNVLLIQHFTLPKKKDH